MVHFCFEIYLWRFKWVIGREVDRDEEQAALVRTFGWADDGRVPVEYVVLRPRASRARGWRIFLQVLYVVTQQIDERTRVVRERPSSSSSSSSSCQSHLGTTFMAIENECNKSGTSSHRSRSSTSFVVSSRFWNVVVVVVVVSKVFSRDVRTHKKRRQKRRLFRGRKEKNAEKKRTHQRRREIRDRARATRRDPSATTPTPEKKRTTFSPRENNNNTTHHKLFRDSFRRHFLRVVFYFCYYKCFRLHTDDVVVSPRRRM